ncbi:amidohydrolase family protein [Pseudonocardia bannensis]|uniref:Amidohydrolase n=1 Tax=Pseudonocardia bannensis TaxID=630973 RepID=A0A848DC00_9PSEU|nr:amidohydrolase family protein [Pseudonocardia bannensis]NMH90091.1 amidohydrolase [Pseudonocardia bannensis]
MSATSGGPACIDCDVHNAVPDISALFAFLPDRWVDYCVESGVDGFDPAFYPPGMPLSARPDARCDGGPPGSDPDLVRAHVLDDGHADHAVLNCLYAVQALHNPDWSAAMASALNDWQAARWLAADPRFRASIVVSPRDPRAAAEEIARVAENPGFVQVLLLATASAPLGRRGYRPIYAAAEAAGLPVAIHPGVGGPNPLSPVGWPSHYIEDYAGAALSLQSQLTSLVCEGVFATHPGLRVVLLESGVTWLPSLMWRFDKNWKALRREVPWVDQPPSRLIREHVLLSVAPFDAPLDLDRDWVDRFLAQLGSVQMLLHASDYPHWHHGDRPSALLEQLSPAERALVLRGNAARLYGLPEEGSRCATA